ncbi:zinc finger protein 25-like [Spodoptera frugiperda]|uniref:Zinc finger protein 25-like n=1 Tax=Spodoptera frugiperda TaxID=7108 RepID=A0A9R0DF93_SPOFR|nr:zinc finger protein 25-like [Spodoptera frugiperda]
MTAINLALNSIINGKNDFCCLCLSSLKDESIKVNDIVVVSIDNNESEIAVLDVLSVVFDEKMCTYINTINSLCEHCTTSAISSYKFKQASQNNAEYLTNVLDGIANNFEYTTEVYDSKCLYVSFNTENLTSKQYYDNQKRVATPKAVLRRFQALENTKKIDLDKMILRNIKKEDDDDSHKTKKKKTRHYIDIPTSDMLVDKNNRNLIRCKECYKEYPTIWNLRNHFIRVHAPKDFKCPKCPRKYGSAAFLEAHKSESHVMAVCSECGKTFKNKHTLKMHEMGHQLTLVCPDCGRVYKNKATFKKHIELNVCGKETRAHPSEAKYTCDYCNKKYTQKVSLRVHIQYEHGNYKSHICEWCGKKFWAQSRLKAHIVKHTREKNFPCSICGGKFVSKESLLYHTRTHTGEKPYKCPHCDIRFLSASRRSDHIKRHHLGATLECDICHTKFNTRTFLLKHKKTHMRSVSKGDEEDLKTDVDQSGTDGQTDSRKTANESKTKDLWICKVEDNSIPGFQKLSSTGEVDLNQLSQQVYEDDAEEGKIYLEVSDDTDDYIKILGV